MIQPLSPIKALLTPLAARPVHSAKQALIILATFRIHPIFLGDSVQYLSKIHNVSRCTVPQSDIDGLRKFPPHILVFSPPLDN